MRSSTRWTTWLCAALLSAGCKTAEPGRGQGDASADAARGASHGSTEPSATPDAAATGGPAAGVDPAAVEKERRARLDRLVSTFRDLSESKGDFFSDNYISNETAYLQVAEAIQRSVPKGGAYIGVGPEQNFTYLALARPSLAFIVDIRRDNALLHLLYKAMFDEASSRAHFVSLWTGRPYEAQGDPGAGGDLAAILAHVEKSAPDRAVFDRVHGALVERVTGTYGIALTKSDLAAMRTAHEAFFTGQLDLRFKLDFNNGRQYPSLRELLLAEDPRGQRLGFLATDESFRFVQNLEREHLVIPVVGDFAGDRAMPGVAKAIGESGVTLSAFYVSNVEQYLLEGKVWDAWVRNVKAMPAGDDAVFIRAYLDQGRAHPLQMKGHRTATVLSRIGDFETRQAERPYTSFFDVATDRLLGQVSGN